MTMFTIMTTFLSPRQGHFEEDKEGKRKFVFDRESEVVVRDMHLRLSEQDAAELVKRWNSERTSDNGYMQPRYRAQPIEA